MIQKKCGVGEMSCYKYLSTFLIGTWGRNLSCGWCEIGTKEAQYEKENTATKFMNFKFRLRQYKRFLVGRNGHKGKELQ